MTIFYAKIETKSKGSKFRAVNSVRTFGESMEDARTNVERLIANWENVSSFRILKISNFPFIIKKFIVVAVLKFVKGSVKTIKVTVREENEEEALKRFRDIINGWNNIASVEIKEIIHA